MIRLDDNRGHAFIWRRSDAFELMERIAKRIKELGTECFDIMYASMMALFDMRTGADDLDEIEKQQDRFLRRMIRRRAPPWISAG